MQGLSDVSVNARVAGGVNFFSVIPKDRPVESNLTVACINFCNDTSEGLAVKRVNAIGDAKTALTGSMDGHLIANLEIASSVTVNRNPTSAVGLANVVPFPVSGCTITSVNGLHDLLLHGNGTRVEQVRLIGLNEASATIVANLAIDNLLDTSLGIFEDFDEVIANSSLDVVNSARGGDTNERTRSAVESRCVHVGELKLKDVNPLKLENVSRGQVRSILLGTIHRPVLPRALHEGITSQGVQMGDHSRSQPAFNDRLQTSRAGIFLPVRNQIVIAQLCYNERTETISLCHGGNMTIHTYRKSTCPVCGGPMDKRSKHQMCWSCYTKQRYDNSKKKNVTKRRGGMYGEDVDLSHLDPAWVSAFVGFFLGEGYVTIRRQARKNGNVIFTAIMMLNLREDDNEVLIDICDKLGGKVAYWKKPEPWNPQVRWTVTGMKRLIAISELFIQSPFRAKKTRDIEILHEFLLYKINLKWPFTNEEKLKLNQYADMIHEVKRYSVVNVH